MTDDNSAEKTPANDKPETPKKVEMTQDDLNALIGKARTETRTQSEKEIAKLKAEYEEKIKLSAMKEEERVKAEKELELKKLNDELTESKRQLRTKAAEAELAKLEIDPAFAYVVLGENDDETVQNIAKLKKQIDTQVAKALDGKLKAGAPAKGGAAGKAVNTDKIRQAAGLPPLK